MYPELIKIDVGQSDPIFYVSITTLQFLFYFVQNSKYLQLQGIILINN